MNRDRHTCAIALRYHREFAKDPRFVLRRLTPGGQGLALAYAPLLEFTDCPGG